VPAYATGYMSLARSVLYPKLNPNLNLQPMLITLNNCKNIQAGIKCVVRGVDVTPGFAEFVSLHYSSFCENAIRCFYMCGFVPWRLRKIPGGDVVPEVLPIGSFHWKAAVRKKQGGVRSKPPLRESIHGRQKRALSKQNVPVDMSETALLAYELKFVHPMPFDECDVEIYEYAQPHMSLDSSCLISPLAHVIVDYRILRQAQIRHAYADLWNTQAKIVCGYRPVPDPYKLNEGEQLKLNP
jgi:hypothetical protein